MRVEDERKEVVYKRHNKKGTPMMLVHESKYLGASYRRAYISLASFALSARAPSLSVYVFAILNRGTEPCLTTVTSDRSIHTTHAPSFGQRL